MNVVTLPYGIEGWREKMRLVEKMLALRSGPPFVYDDMLILVPSARMKRDYGRLFIQTIERLFGTTALVPPEVQTLHQFLYLLNARLNGPSLMDENSRLVLFEGIVKELITGKAEFGPHPDILAPSLSAAVADLIDRLSSAGITSERLSATVAASDFADKPQVRLLTAAYARYDRMLADNGLLLRGNVIRLQRQMSHILGPK